MGPQVPIQKTEKVNNWMPVMAIALFVLLSLSTVAFLYYQNQQLKKLLANSQIQPTPIPSPVASPIVIPSSNPETIADWKNEILGKLTLKIPPTWEGGNCAFLGVDGLIKTYGPPNTENPAACDPVRVFQIFEQDTPIESADESTNETPIVFNNIQGTRVEIDGLDGLEIAVYFENDNKYYKAVLYRQDELETFYQVLSTFEFANPSPTPVASQRACTMEAKACPDGSYVGRTGPNCEFAPCPGTRY